MQNQRGDEAWFSGCPIPIALSNSAERVALKLTACTQGAQEPWSTLTHPLPSWRLCTPHENLQPNQTQREKSQAKLGWLSSLWAGGPISKTTPHWHSLGHLSGV